MSSGAQGSPERAQVLEDEAADAFRSDDLATARTLYLECRAIYSNLKRPSDEARVVTQLARCAVLQGEPTAAEDLYDVALTKYRAVADRIAIGDTLEQRAVLALTLGKADYAVRLLHECVELCERDARSDRLPTALYHLSAALLRQGYTTESRKVAARAEMSCQFTRESLELAESILRLAGEVALVGDIDRASDLCRASIASYRQAGYLAGLNKTLHNLVTTVRLDSRSELFKELCEALLALYAAGKRAGHNPRALCGLARLSLRAGGTSDAYALTKEALALSQDASQMYDRSACYLEMGCIAWREGHDDLARSLFDRSFSALKESMRFESLTNGNSDYLFRMLRNTQRICEAEDFSAAAVYFTRTALEARSKGEIAAYVRAICYRARVYLAQGEFQPAIRDIEECVLHYSSVAAPSEQHPLWLGRCLMMRGASLCAVGEVDRGRSCLLQALEVAGEQNDREGALDALNQLGTFLPSGTNRKFEHACLAKAVDRSADSPEDYLRRGTLSSVGHLLLLDGDVSGAGRLFLHCLLTMTHETRIQASVIALEGLFFIAFESGLDREAALLLGKATALQRRMNSSLWRRREDSLEAINIVSSRFGAQRWSETCGEGETLTDSQTLSAAWKVLEARGY